MKHGYLTGINLTTSASRPPVQVKTVIKIKGDPGYQGSSSRFFFRADDPMLINQRQYSHDIRMCLGPPSASGFRQ